MSLSPDTLAVNQEPADERQTLLSIPMVAGALAAPKEIALSAPKGTTVAVEENASDGPTVERSTAGVLAISCALESPSGEPKLNPALGGATPSLGTQVPAGNAAAGVPELLCGFAQA